MLGTPAWHEEKSTDSVIQYTCMLEGTVQVNVPEFPRLEMVIHLHVGRNGASERSRVSEAGDGYSTDHAVHRQEAQRQNGHEPE